ncbi:hypothetical protein Kfla_2405 [Kribbella flavida DSM 17836]|uniref:Uncharacterized protein n=1 Tax=Kribbella flavida (strain DSM 17836 / JCM 10339 / NBRC 14399) TaxID=479435 RepID=D2PV13_KRIFD|nr:hypothetical protein [Kribbella flavida]ADB31479.1 hypothetical protein Kfla_2405 [Kribbella flavida DSM 17836]
MADQRAQVERWVSFAAGIVAPVTLISALLFYFGYVSARSQYEYFGIDVDTIGLSTQDYVMRSPQPLLVPLLVLTLIAVAGLLLHNAIQPTATAVRRTRVVAVALLLVGVVALFLYPAIGHVPYYPLVVPLLIGLAAAALGYLSYLSAHLADQRPPVILIVLLGVVTTTCAFWATATTAQYSGRGLAKSDAQNLGQFPVVILDTKERLQLRSPGLEETALRAGAGQTFNYRYRGLRLLVVGENRLFLVPERWTPSNTTLVVSLDSSIRVQFQFQNDPP